jgi:large subunit ribosomal protein L17
MANSLIMHEQIKTTLPKAKELRGVVEKLITTGKKGDLHARRQLVSQLQNKENANKVIEILAERYKKRAGGYTRVIKAGYRYGDASPMAVIEMVDRPAEPIVAEKVEVTKAKKDTDSKENSSEKKAKK